MSVRWDEDTERLAVPAVEDRLAIVRSANRAQADVLRSAREGYPLVVLLPLYQEPVDSLMQLRPYLTDDELAVVARALGF